MDIKLNENEVIEELGYKGLKLVQNKKYFCFGMDAILLSDFAKEIKGNCIDLGSGTGILSVLLSKKSKLNKIYAVEFQDEMAELIVKNIKLNNLDRVELIKSDILNLNIENQVIDNIVCNPPYKQAHTGIENSSKQINLSKYESTATLEDFIKVSSRLLKPNGGLYMVFRPDRLQELISCLNQNNLELKELRFVYSKKQVNADENEKKENINNENINNENINKENTNKENTKKQKENNSKLVLIKAVKGAKPFLKVLEPLYIYEKDNIYTDEIYKIYNMEKK